MSLALFLPKNLQLSIGKVFCSFPCQNFAPLSWTLLFNSAEFTLCVPKYVALFEIVRILRRFGQMAWQGIETPIEFPAAPSFFSSKKWIKLIPTTIGNRKRDCAWGCARGINTTWENLQIEKHKSGRRSFRSPDWFQKNLLFLSWLLTDDRVEHRNVLKSNQLPTFTTGFVLPSMKIVYYQHLLVSFEELLSLRFCDHFALVVGCINHNWLNDLSFMKSF